MRVSERRHLGRSVELLDDALNVSLISTRSAQLVQLVLEFLSLGHLAERSRQPGALLRGDLGGRRVLAGDGITEGVDVGCTEDAQVFIGEDTSTVRLRFRKLAHEFARELSRRVTGGPDEETVWNLVCVLVGVLNEDGLFPDVLDGRSGHDVNLVGPERGFRVLDQLLGKGRQDVGQGFDQGDSELVGDLGVPLAQVVLERSERGCLVEGARTYNQKVVQFTGVLDTGGTATDDDHVHESVNLLFALSGKRSGLDACDAFRQHMPKVGPVDSQSSNFRLILSASFNSFKKHPYSLTPLIPNVWFSAPTPYTK